MFYNLNFFRDCVALQDPHCAWDVRQSACVSVDAVSTLKRALIQDVSRGDGKRCWSPPTGIYYCNCHFSSLLIKLILVENKKIPAKVYDKSNVENEIIPEEKVTDSLLKTSDDDLECEDGLTGNRITGCAVRQHLVIYTAKTLHIVVVCASLAALLIGFIAGYLFSRRFHPQSHYPDAPFIEQHNHLDRYVLLYSNIISNGG